MTQNCCALEWSDIDICIQAQIEKYKKKIREEHEAREQLMSLKEKLLDEINSAKQQLELMAQIKKELGQEKAENEKLLAKYGSLEQVSHPSLPIITASSSTVNFARKTLL